MRRGTLSHVATWRGVPVFLGWQVRFGTPKRAWADRFGAQLRESDQSAETERELAIRLQPLAVELGAIVDINRSSDGLSVRLVAPAIGYVRGGQPPRVIDGEIEFVGGPRNGEREHVDTLPDTLQRDDACYRRAFHCAIDNTVRYVWDRDPC